MQNRLIFWFFLFVWATLVTVSFLLGKDLNWDFLNYHFYGPHLLLDGRLNKDYFAASFQSYLNPAAHVPHYLMIRAGWGAVSISVVLVSFHVLNLVLIWVITRELLPKEGVFSVGFLGAAVILAALAPLYVTTVGSSFADPTTSVFVLAGIFCSLKTANSTQPYRVWWGVSTGVFLGLASGLKLTNGVLSVGVIVPLLACWMLQKRSKLPAMVAGVLAGFFFSVVVMHGYWSWLLWETFGNPVFPLLNQIFQSPDFPSVSYRDTRFLGDGWWGLVQLPFLMTLPLTWLYAENAAVDLRPLTLLLILFLVISRSLVNVFRVERASLVVATPGRAGLTLVLLSVMALTMYALWGATTKIGRYALPLWLLIGPLCVAWCVQLFRRPAHALVLIAMLMLAQTYALFNAGNPRWSPALWGEKWLDVRVPQELQLQPTTLLTLGKQSYSLIVPYLHPDARVVNLIGQYVQPAASAMPGKLKTLLSEPSDSLRVVFRDKDLVSPYNPMLSAATRADVNSLLSVYGLRLSDNKCEPILMRAQYMSGGNVVSEVETVALRPKLENERLQVCKLNRLGAAEHGQTIANRAVVKKVFDAVESACGAQLSPHGSEALHGRDGWMRVYFNSLQSLSTDGEIVYIRPFYSMSDVTLGSFTDWSGSNVPPCPTLPASIVRP